MKLIMAGWILSEEDTITPELESRRGIEEEERRKERTTVVEGIRHRASKGLA